MRGSGRPLSRLLVDYARERFPLRRYAPLSLLFATAALSGDRSAGWIELLRGAALSLALLFQLRLWDDLADQARDRAEHPARVLSRAPLPAIAKLRAVLVLVAVINAAVLAGVAPFPGHVLVFIALSTGLLLWYGVLRRFVRSAAAASLVVLAKYPVLVYLVSLAPEGPAARYRPLAAALVYFSFCAYEVLHDPRVRGEKIAVPLLGAEMVSMLVVASWMGVIALRASVSAAALHAVMTLISSLGLTLLFLRCRRSGALPAAGQGVFVLCFLLIVSSIVGTRL